MSTADACLHAHRLPGALGRQALDAARLCRAGAAFPRRPSRRHGRRRRRWSRDSPASARRAARAPRSSARDRLSCRARWCTARASPRRTPRPAAPRCRRTDAPRSPAASARSALSLVRQVPATRPAGRSGKLGDFKAAVAQAEDEKTSCHLVRIAATRFFSRMCFPVRRWNARTSRARRAVNGATYWRRISMRSACQPIRRKGFFAHTSMTPFRKRPGVSRLRRERL